MSRSLTALMIISGLASCTVSVPDSSPVTVDAAASALSSGGIASAPLDANDLLANDAVAAVTGSTTLSGENDFGAVSDARSIEQDAARVAANREAYQQVSPEELRERPRGQVASVVEFALSTQNTVGQALYSRLTLGAQARAARNCAKYPSPDRAQEYFLANGGPTRNPQGLDPDGDGFACAWDPSPFRLAAQAPQTSATELVVPPSISLSDG